MSSDTGTRELADGMPGYRLVRREDIDLRPALPGHSSGLTACRLVDGSLGSTHMALTLVSLATPGCGAPCMFWTLVSAVGLGTIVAGLAYRLTGLDHG